MNRTVDQEIQWQAAGKQVYLAIQEAWCNPPKEKPEDTFGAFLQRATDAVLNLPEIEVRDKEQTSECTRLNENGYATGEGRGMITQDYLNGRASMLDTGFVKVIPK